MTELAGNRDQARADAERVVCLVERTSAPVTPDTLRRFAQAARLKLRNGDGAFRRDHLRVLAQRVDVIGGCEIRITGSKGKLLQTHSAATGGETATIGIRSFIPEWRAMVDENEYYTFEIAL